MSADPKLTKTKVTIAYTSDDRYRYQWDARGGKGSEKYAMSGIEIDPKISILHGLSELTRLCELFGFGDEAQERFNASRDAVKEWRGTRAKQEPGHG